MTLWTKPTPAQVKESRFLAGFDRIDDAASAFGINRRTWASWELPRDDANARQMSPRDWLLWRILTNQVAIDTPIKSTARKRYQRG